MSLPERKLDELRRLVAEEPGSRLFLGLAEELMRRGEREEALRVLDAGLAARPGQVAATVARARCLVDLDRPLEAWNALESVIARDPTHLVAAKLAVEVWLRTGDRRRARESLDRYAPLGAADPDLVRLRARVRELEESTSAPAAGVERGGASTAAPPPAPAATPAPPPAPAATPAPPETVVPAPAEEDEMVTVTLGNLYLLQGHRSEAERIFRRVLRSDPDNRAARQALARALSPGAAAGGRQDV